MVLFFSLVAFLSTVLSESTLVSNFPVKIPSVIYFVFILKSFVKIPETLKTKMGKYVIAYFILLLFNYIFVVGDLFWRPVDEIPMMWAGVLRRIVLTIDVLWVIKSFDDFTTIFRWYVLGLLCSSYLAYPEMFLLKHALFDSSLTVGNEGYQRALGFFSNGNEFGISIVLCAAFLLVQFSRTKKIYNFIGMVGLIPPLLFTYSRAAWVSFVVMLIAYAYFSDSKKKYWYYIIILTILCAFIMAMLYTPEIRDRLFLLTEGNDGSALSRLFTFDVALNAWLQNMIFGIGVYKTMTLSDNLIGGENFGLSLHNFYLQSLFETGIVGFVITMSFLVYLYKQTLSKYSQNNEMRYFLQLSKIFLPAYFLYIIFGNHIQHEYFWYMITGMIAIQMDGKFKNHERIS